MQRKGFTLIELLIVIGLLAALAAVLLPSLMGDRTKALENVCNYNQAGTLRTLKQYETMTSGMLPNGLHTGLETDGSVMGTLPAALAANMGLAPSAALDSEDVAALNAIGITKLAYGTGDPGGTSADDKIGYIPLTGSANVVVLSTDWKNDAGDEYSFNGKTFSLLTEEGYDKIIPLFIAPSTDWSSSNSVGWVKGFEVSMELPGACPVPDADFAYYMAYVGIKQTGEATYTITTSGDAPALTFSVGARGSIDGLETAIDGETLPANWTQASTGWGRNADDTASTCMYEYEDTVNNVTGSATVYVKYDPTPSAKLLGTSCPECGITNP